MLQNPPRKVSQTLCPLPLGQVPACFSHPFVFCISVDNDPHFIIHLPKSQRNICFNINSEPGKILNLVSDPGTGKGIKHGFKILLKTLLSGLKGVQRQQGKCLQGRLCANSSVASRLGEVVISLHIWSPVPSWRLADTRKMVTNWIKFSGGHQDDYGAGAQNVQGEAETIGFGQS